jgi:hypothetical protein
MHGGNLKLDDKIIKCITIKNKIDNIRFLCVTEKLFQFLNTDIRSRRTGVRQTGIGRRGDQPNLITGLRFILSKGCVAAV